MKMKTRWRKSSGLAAVYTVAVMCSSASGAGLALTEQSVEGLGNAYAGGAAAADNASTIFSNPAGLARLRGSEFIAGVHTAFPSAKFRNEGSLHATGTPLTGADGDNAGVTIVIPNLYYSNRLTIASARDWVSSFLSD